MISFEPIDSVNVLRDAEDLEAARRDVETLVVSPRLAEQLTEVILPNLDLDSAPDAKGMLVVANYGTGKTHLMSVVSSILEHADLAELVQSDAVREAAARVAGRYRVIRAEIGATTMGLRDIITTELSDGLRRLGVDFDFPDLSQVTNTKRSLDEMMAAFETAHGDQGLLFVLDEMLDYLASRRDNELRVDLAVLREIGEFCKSTRFRFIGGVQEAIFDNPRFASAADAVIRVRERFSQMCISREDIAFMVQERLLRKTAEQKAKIRAHLLPFAPAYEGMAEDLEAFVALFPVHPAYLALRTHTGRRVTDRTAVLWGLRRQGAWPRGQHGEAGRSAGVRAGGAAGVAQAPLAVPRGVLRGAHVHRSGPDSRAAQGTNDEPGGASRDPSSWAPGGTR